MSKESPERGLHRLFHGGPEAPRAKAEGPTKQGRFVPDSQDWARLLDKWAGNERRMT